jgi:hypothetical protein
VHYATMALLRIKEEPKDGENEPSFKRSLFDYAQKSSINAVGIEELRFRNQLNLEHARVTQNRRENIRKRCVRSNVSSSSSSSSASHATPMDVDEDACVNSDEERSRKASEIKYTKELERQSKRARRRTNPPDEWKKTLDAMRPDNVLLDEIDLRRICEAGSVATLDKPEDAMDAKDGNHAKSTIAPRITGKKNKTHIGYPPIVPLVAQQLYVPLEPVISDEVRDVLAQIDVQKPNEKPVLVFDDARGPVNVPMTSYNLATNLTKASIANGVTVPTSYDITLRPSEMDELMLCSRTDDQGRLFSEKFLQEVMCRPEDRNFIYNKLRKTTLYNCPLSRVGTIDDYLAYMTTHTRKVNEQMSRACYPHERPCIEDLRCVGRCIPLSEPVTLVEYFSMSDIEDLRKNGVWTKPRRHCILCKWDQATKTAFNVLAECAAYSDKMVRMRMLGESNYDPQRRALMLVDYCDVVGEKEYSPYDVMVSNLNRYIGLIAPVVIFVTKRFKQEKIDGILHYIHDYERSNRNLGEWVTLVSRESSSMKSASQTRAKQPPPTINTKFFLPPPPPQQTQNLMQN